MSTQCLCGRNKPFEQCCGRYLSGKQFAKTPEQLMRSRYSAYALGGYGQYLLDTWHSMMSQGLSAEDLSQQHYEWTGLEVLNKTQSGDSGTVEFKAYYNDKDQQQHVMHENSCFQRVAGRWFYVGATTDE